MWPIDFNGRSCDHRTMLITKIYRELQAKCWVSHRRLMRAYLWDDQFVREREHQYWTGD
jgi:hypothetical protein